VLPPIRRSLSRVTGPTPGITPTDSGRSSATSVPGSTMQTPSGLSSSLATLAMNLELPTPTEAVSPPVTSATSVLSRVTRSRSPAGDRSTGSGATSRSTNASSSDSGSTRGDSARSVAITCRLASR